MQGLGFSANHSGDIVVVPDNQNFSGSAARGEVSLGTYTLHGSLGFAM